MEDAAIQFKFKLSKDLDIEEAISFAMKVPGITVTKKGSQDSIPTMDELLRFVL